MPAATMATHESSSSPETRGTGLPIVVEPRSNNELNRPTMGESESRSTTPRNDTMKEVQVPTHPIPSMQDAFVESMMEASTASTPITPKVSLGTAASRRQALLEQDTNEETHAARWQPKPGQKSHQLWKLMAQISFGIYLLLNGIAKNDDQVMTILQGHVDEVDEFLETTLEDFDLAQHDIDERLKYLRLPLENIVVFDAMLEDRSFRLQIVSGNENIEHVITRTANAMKDALKAVKHGLDACKEFTVYLEEEQEDSIWKDDRPDMQKVFDAMKGNVEGWYKAYVSLQTKGNSLGVALVQLGSIVAEMDRRAGEISRKTRFATEPTPLHSEPVVAPQPVQQSHNPRQLRLSMSKNLPSDPNLITPAIRATLPAFQLVPDRERTPELTSDASSEVESRTESEFTLKPHTYSPMPSPNPQQQSFQESDPPEIRRKSSLRRRFSLKRKEAPSEVTLKPPPRLSEDNYWGPRQRVHSVSSSTIRGRESAITTPPSRGLDSAYCSDFEKTSPPAISHPSMPSHQSTDSTATLRPATLKPTNLSPLLTHDFIPSPRSDQQFFRPVQASPHSPLQRPWTAGAGSNPLHMYHNSSTSHLPTNTRSREYSHYNQAHNAPQLRRHPPSTMGMSVMSDMTTAEEIGEDGVKRKVKKKRSAFGWLKKAFSLSEEEKRLFEERKRGMGDAQVKEARPPKWIDGKRVR